MVIITSRIAFNSIFFILITILSQISLSERVGFENGFQIPIRYARRSHHHHHPYPYQDEAQRPPLALTPNSNTGMPEAPDTRIVPEPSSGIIRLTNTAPILIRPITPLEDTKNINGELCPAGNPELKISYRYFNETGKCYTPGRGDNPCGENMLFYSLPGDQVYGDCDCKRYAGCDYRPLVYWLRANRCFHLFEQGPCKAGEWLTFDRRHNPACTKRTCPQNKDEDPLKIWISFHGTCHQLSTRAFCRKSNETIHYEIGDLEPKCFDTPVDTPTCGRTKTVLAGAPTLPCGPGQKKSGSGACATSVSF